MEELIRAFSMDKVQKAGAKFNPDKAKWFNKEYLRTKSDAELAELFMPVLREKLVNGTCISTVAPDNIGDNGAPAEIQAPYPNGTSGAAKTDGATMGSSATAISAEYVTRVAGLIKERATFVKDFWDIAWYLFTAPKEFNEKDMAKFWKEENYSLMKQAVDNLLQADIAWDKEAIEENLVNYIKANEWPMGKVMNCLRLALSGSASGLGIADILSLIGKEECRRRIDYIFSL